MDPPKYSDLENPWAALGDGIRNLDIDNDDGVDRLVIGLDFGTTFSGVAYAFTTKPDQIYTINEWPGLQGRNAPKVPTLIKYDDNGGMKWGYELDRTLKDRIEGIKLLLDPEQPKPLYAPAIDTEAVLKKLGKPAIEVATDYISAIYEHALKKIEAKYPRNYLNMLEKQYILSVPAVWSDKAQDATLRAARNAGISPVKLIKEPEAAAMFTLHHMKDRGLEVGDAFVICDAGGGTVDLISYEILKLQPLELKELVGSTGGMAGSLMLNRRFKEWVKQVVGDRVFLELEETDAYRRAMKDFDENIKPGFRSRDDEEQYVNFPKANLQDNPSKGLKSNTISVPGHALHDIFDPVFRDVDKLVAEQVKDVYLKRLKDRHPKGFDIKAIFLVGGFGSSTYLYESISQAHPEIQVIQPNDAWSAIVRGAVMSQLPREASVISNVALKHYGVSGHQIYNDTRDAGQEKFYDNLEGNWRCHTMTWYIQKGDDLRRSRNIEFPFYRNWSRAEPDHAELQIVSELSECSAPNAPVHPKTGITTRNCTLNTDLSTVPKELFKRRSRVTSNGETVEWWELHFKLLVTIQSGPMVFSLVIGGKEYGQVGTVY